MIPLLALLIRCVATLALTPLCMLVLDLFGVVVEVWQAVLICAVLTSAGWERR